MIDFQSKEAKRPHSRRNAKMRKGAKINCTDNWHSFTALRGVQAGREYYVAMCPVKVIPKIFLFDEVELAPELRAQRTLNRARIPEIARYLTENPSSYSFSSITASIDADTMFEPFDEAGPASNAGRLLIPMTARFLINDGQHRRAAIEEALKERPELGDEMLSVVFFIDAGLKRSQQMFADLNRHAIRPTKSLGILYDRRDPLSQLACRLVDHVSVFKNMTEMEKTSIPNRSNRLHTLSSIYQATRTLLAKSNRCKVTEADEQLATDFWEAVAKAIPDWSLAAQKKVSCAELRRDYIHAHGIALQALGIAGAALLAESRRDWKRQLATIERIDWSRANTEQWEGRALVNGRVSKANVNVMLTSNLLKSHLGLDLGVRERQLENQFSHGRHAA
jgi:DNA sulfur modification protein DndB